MKQSEQLEYTSDPPLVKGKGQSQVFKSRSREMGGRQGGQEADHGNKKVRSRSWDGTSDLHFEDGIQGGKERQARRASVEEEGETMDV